METVSLLTVDQGISLRRLHLTRYTEANEFLTLMAKHITHLEVDGLSLDVGNEWICRLLAANHKHLRVLRLGSDSRVAEDYSSKTERVDSTIPESFANTRKWCSPADDRGLMPSLQLNSLGICGIEAAGTLQGDLGFHFDLENLTVLKLESCAGLLGALALFAPEDGSPKFLLPSKLNTLFIRHELREDATHFNAVLERFLTSFSGLAQLEVLVDETDRCLALDSILEAHGKTLKRLLWEERTGERLDMSEDTSLFPGKIKNLTVVGRYCPHLVSLALPLEWKAVTRSNRFHSEVMITHLA